MARSKTLRCVAVGGKKGVADKAAQTETNSALAVARVELVSTDTTPSLSLPWVFLFTLSGVLVSPYLHNDLITTSFEPSPPSLRQADTRHLCFGFGRHIQG